MSERLYGGHALAEIKATAKEVSKSFTTQVVQGDVFHDIIAAVEEAEQQYFNLMQSYQREKDLKIERDQLCADLERERKAHAEVVHEVEQLRAELAEWQTIGSDKATQQEIVKLRAENERLRNALARISEYWNGSPGVAAFDMAGYAKDEARRALEGE